MACSQCEGIEGQFNRAEADRSLRRLRRRGPDRTTRLLLDALRQACDETSARVAVLLDIGAGVGAIHHELLEAHVERAIHIDASSAHLAAAREETVRRGHAGRVEFLSGDFVSIADRVAPADLVTLDRVICCYHDMPRLVRPSAERARRLYGAVYPRGNRWMRTGIAVINVLQRLKGSDFRVFVHEPAAIDAVLHAAGLTRRSMRRTLAWEVVVYERR
jgi:magnesium-protoporphyrin O-methyltransferase